MFKLKANIEKHIINAILLNAGFSVENETLPKRINFGKTLRVNPSFSVGSRRRFFEAIKPIFVVNEDAFEVKYGVKS